jgi:hypothetical protein
LPSRRWRWLDDSGNKYFLLGAFVSAHEWVPLPIAERIAWQQGVDHTWEDCYCGCDPDWHYLDVRPWAPMLHCSNCKKGDT